MFEVDLIDRCFSYLEKELEGRQLKKAFTADSNEIDAVFYLDGQPIHIEAKNEIRPYHIPRLEKHARGFSNFIVVANYISPKVKRNLKELNVNYIDNKGNMRFKMEATHIYIDGIPNRPLVVNIKSRAFTKAGVKVVFQILIDADLINFPYREIAKKADVALGTVPLVLKGLKEEGYILKKNEKELILVNENKLIERWSLAYVQRLKPSLLIKRFKYSGKDFHNNWAKLVLDNGTQWGGEPGANLLTGHLLPGEFVMYTDQSIKEIILRYRLKPDPNGGISAYYKFWKTPANTGNSVHLLIIYADLLETNSPRCLETANLIYERFLQKH